jgi:hypothetical protein
VGIRCAAVVVHNAVRSSAPTTLVARRTFGIITS